jgi:hypothetical protein
MEYTLDGSYQKRAQKTRRSLDSIEKRRESGYRKLINGTLTTF